MDKTEARFNELVEDKNINLEKMYQVAQDEDLGDSDGVNSRETPTPIRNKKDLREALGY